MTTGRGPARRAVEGAPQREASLVSRAYESLKERIITLSFLPGQYLNEASVCDLLELGRTPVHQAFQRLQVEGLVEVMPRKGIVVLPDSISEILKILDSRLTVEPELARKACETALRPDARKALRALAVRTDENREPPDIAAFTANDRAFHARIGELSGNKVMSEFARRLHERSTRFWYLRLWQTLDVPRTNGQHAAIADAICRGDADRASDAMREHITVLKKVLEALDRAAPSRPERDTGGPTRPRSARRGKGVA